MLSREYIRDTFENFSTKELLIFLFFLVISALFWFMSTANDTYEEEFPVRLEIVDVPKDIVITQSLPDTVRVTLHDKGFNLMRYLMYDDLAPLQLDFDTYASGNGKGGITVGEIQKLLRARLLETTSITSVKADRLYFYFNHGASKKVPILIDGQLIPTRNYYVTRTMMSPDSAVVYAALGALDTINAVYTVAQTITGIKTSFSKTVPLHLIDGAKIVPEKVKMTVIADQMTEVTVNVPITTINVPEGTSLKTFPARMDITIAVGLKRSRSIHSEQFTIVADYNDITADPNAKLRVRVQTQPTGVIRSTLQTDVVDYVIEKY